MATASDRRRARPRDPSRFTCHPRAGSARHSNNRLRTTADVSVRGDTEKPRRRPWCETCREEVVSGGQGCWRPDNLLLIQREILMISLNVTALSIVVPTILAVATANAQQQAPPKSRGSVAAFVVMTPSGPATCATWV